MQEPHTVNPKPPTHWAQVRSLAKQLQLCVGANKKAPAPLNLHFVGMAGGCPARAACQLRC
jgi:hypothetical protein